MDQAQQTPYGEQPINDDQLASNTSTLSLDNLQTTRRQVLQQAAAMNMRPTGSSTADARSPFCFQSSAALGQQTTYHWQTAPTTTPTNMLTSDVSSGDFDMVATTSFQGSVNSVAPLVQAGHGVRPDLVSTYHQYLNPSLEEHTNTSDGYPTPRVPISSLMEVVDMLYNRRGLPALTVLAILERDWGMRPVGERRLRQCLADWGIRRIDYNN